MNLLIILTLFVGVFLALSNGANDNFKGVATLLGSGTASHKKALIWATVTTLSGSIVAIFLATKLIHSFSGKGLVPDEVSQLSSFSLSVSLSAALTVFLATKIGFPISTTHALTGALVGSGIIASPIGVNFVKLWNTFFIPLLTSPMLSLVATLLIYPFFKFVKKLVGVKRESCICIGNSVLSYAPVESSSGIMNAIVKLEDFPQITIGTKVNCEERYIGEMFGLNAKSILDFLHFISSGLVGFARGLNDTPKIAAIILLGGSLSASLSIGVIAVAIAMGGLFWSRKIAETMSYQITKMNDGQGFTANLITSMIVIGASKFGLPVSTTHVSCGALFGVGTVTGNANWKSIIKILAAWIITLPVSSLLSMLLFYVFDLINK